MLTEWLIVCVDRVRLKQTTYMSAAASSPSPFSVFVIVLSSVVVLVVEVTRAAMPACAVLARSTDDSSTRSSSCRGSDRGVDAAPAPTPAPADDDDDDGSGVVVGNGDSSRRPLCMTMASAPAGVRQGGLTGWIDGVG